MSDNEQIEKAKAVGHIPSGLFIVTARADSGAIDGYLASWVQQVSFSPLLVSLAINPSRPGYASIMEGNVFTINIVGEHESQYLRHFYKGYAPGQGPFGEIPHFVSDQGGVVIEAAKSAIDCRLTQKIKPGDHEIIIAEVLASHVNNAEAKPKTYVRKSGLDY